MAQQAQPAADSTAHVYITSPGLGFKEYLPNLNSTVTYDDANRQLLLASESKVYIWPLRGAQPGLTPRRDGSSHTLHASVAPASSSVGNADGHAATGATSAARAGDDEGHDVANAATPAGGSMRDGASLAAAAMGGAEGDGAVDDANHAAADLSEAMGVGCDEDGFPLSPDVCFVNDGPVLAVRFSLDGKIVALQRSSKEIEFVNRERVAEFWQRCKKTSEKILGFFWTRAPECDIVFVTTCGLEMYQLLPGRNGLALTHTKKHSTSWYKYTHDSRLLLLATGTQCNKMFGYQFTEQAVLKIPRFEIRLSATNAASSTVPNSVPPPSSFSPGGSDQQQQQQEQQQEQRYGSDPSLADHAATTPLLISSSISQSHSQSDLTSTAAEAGDATPATTARASPLSSAVTSLFRTPGGHAPNSGASSSSSKRVLVPEDIEIVTMYGRLYCAFTDRARPFPKLSLYRFYRDCVEEQLTIPLYGYRVGLSVIDNALIVHYLDSKMAMVYDVLALESGSSEEPVASPLPLAVLHHASTSAGVVDTATAPSASDGESTASRELYGETWCFLMPDLVLDHTNCSLHRFRLDLEAIAASSSDRPRLVAFLQRRTTASIAPRRLMAAASAEGPVDAKQLTAATLRVMILDRESLETISQVMSVVCLSYAQAVSALQSGARGPGKQAVQAHRSCTVLSPSEFYELVLKPVEEEIAGIDWLLVASVTVEYMRCCYQSSLPQNPQVCELLLRLLAAGDPDGPSQSFQIFQLMHHGAIPDGHAIRVLRELAMDDPALKHTFYDALRRTQVKDSTVEALMQEDRLLEALRCVRRNRVETIPPTAFLEAAQHGADPLVFASVYRFCAEFVPGFSAMAAFPKYANKLRELCPQLPSQSTEPL